MIKLKRIIPFVLAVCMVFSLCCFVGCSTAELQSLSIDATDAKTEFMLGQEYSSTGLVVTANYSTGESEAVDLSSVTIDSSKYDPYTKGTYEISVSYSDENGSASATYNVSVVDALFGGLVVTLKDGWPAKYTLSAGTPTVSFTKAPDWIEVRKPDKNGEVDMSSSALSKDSYTVKVYKGADEVSDLSAVNRGYYHIWASMYDETEDYTYEGFTTIRVFDDVSSIVWKEGTLSQVKGLRELMTPTWKFTVTYNSGDTDVVDRTSPYISISSINPNVAATSGTATVKYQEPDTREQTTSVTYTLEGPQKNPDLAILNFNSYEKDYEITNETVKTEFVDFDILKGKIVDKSATITLPTGIVVDGRETTNAGLAWQSGGASSPTNGRYINFSANRAFEIYIYAESNGDDDRCMFFETENDYAVINLIEGYVGNQQIQGINGVATSYKGDNLPYSVHAASVTGLTTETPADFSISFDGSVNVLYVLIIFPEEA